MDKNTPVKMADSATTSEEFSEDPYSMTEEKLRLRALNENRGRYLSQLYCALTGAVCFGLVLGWSCPAIRQHLDLQNQDTTFPSVAGLAPLGASIGCALLEVLKERRGPRLVVLIICPLQVICWILIISIPNESVYKSMIFCSGFLSIGFIVCGETMLWDSVHAGHTTQFMVLFESSVLLGVCLSFVIGLNETEPMYYSILGAVLVTITFIMYAILPESPVYLYGKHPSKAEKALKFLRGETNIYDDMRHIKKDYELRAIDISAKYMFSKKVVYRAVLIIIGLFFFREFSGYYALLSFGLTILSEQGGDDNQTPMDVFGKVADGVLLGLIFYISRIFSCLILARGVYGVRKPIISSSVLVTLCLFMMSIYFYLNDILQIFPDSINFLKLILNGLLIISFEVGYSLTPDIVQYDYLPFQVYPWVKLLSMTMRWLFVYLMVVIIINIGMDDVTTWQNYLFLFCVSFVGIIFNCVFLVESKDKTLVQIQSKLGGNPVGSRSSRRNRGRIVN